MSLLKLVGTRGRLLRYLDVAWERATHGEVEVLVGWLRVADNPQRRRHRTDAAPAGTVNVKTGKRAGVTESSPLAAHRPGDCAAILLELIEEG